MKIQDLVQRTGVPKQTIHYYVRYGVLPKPRKLGSNSADWSEEHARRIGLIKNLQEHFYLPLSVIKKVLRKHRGQGGSPALLEMRAEYFRPLDQLLAGEIQGEDAFCEATGLLSEPLRKYESWGIITPALVDGVKVYSHDDQVIGRIIAQYREIGMTAELGFEQEILESFVTALQKVVAESSNSFFERARRSLNRREITEVSRLAGEVTALLCYHLSNKLAREERDRGLEELFSKDRPPSEPNIPVPDPDAPAPARTGAKEA